MEGVAEAVGGGYCRLQMPSRLALGVPASRPCLDGLLLQIISALGKVLGGRLCIPFLACVPDHLNPKVDGRAPMVNTPYVFLKITMKPSACLEVGDVALDPNPFTEMLKAALQFIAGILDDALQALKKVCAVRGRGALGEGSGAVPKMQ